jgi:hypothetical protein
MNANANSELKVLTTGILKGAFDRIASRSKPTRVTA